MLLDQRIRYWDDPMLPQARVSVWRRFRRRAAPSWEEAGTLGSAGRSPHAH